MESSGWHAKIVPQVMSLKLFKFNHSARHGEVAGRPADIWSMGVTLYCLKYGKLPFAKTNMIELFDSIKSDP